MTPPLLLCRDARIDGPDGPLAPRLNASADGRRVVLAGHWGAVVAVLSGTAHVVAGTLEIDGMPAHAAVTRGHLGLSLADARTPRDWTVREYLRQSAELIGTRPREARRLADAAMERLGLGALATRRLAFLDTASRRAAWLAHAIMGEPEVVLVERPFEQLDAQQASYVGRVLDQALIDRRALFVLDTLAVTGPDASLVDTADVVVFATGAGVVASGPPEQVRAPARRYVLAPLRNGAALATELEQRGLETKSIGGSAERLVVTLPDPSTVPIVEAVLAADAPLAEMTPLSFGARP